MNYIVMDMNYIVKDTDVNELHCLEWWTLMCPLKTLHTIQYI